MHASKVWRIDWPRSQSMILVVLVVGLALGLQPRSATASPAAVAQTVPRKKTPPQSTPSPGQKLYVLYFYFAPERCPHCRAMAPVIERFYRAYGLTAASLDDDDTTMAFLEKQDTRLASLGEDGLRGALLAPDLRLVQAIETKPPSTRSPPPQGPSKGGSGKKATGGAADASQRFEVYGVPIYSWGSDVAGFRRQTGMSFPTVGDPGLPVDTAQHPTTVFYNKQTNVTRIAAVGEVSYASLVAQKDLFITGRAGSTARGAS